MFFFFFKQKTAYEMRISDWSSDVCSSDLPNAGNSANSSPAAIGSTSKPISRRGIQRNIIRDYRRTCSTPDITLQPRLLKGGNPTGMRLGQYTWCCRCRQRAGQRGPAREPCAVGGSELRQRQHGGAAPDARVLLARLRLGRAPKVRPEERRVGHECVSTCRPRGSP